MNNIDKGTSVGIGAPVTNIELEIAKLLRLHGDGHRVAEKLLEQLNDEIIKVEDFFAVVNFALNSGAHIPLARHFQIWFRRSANVPWCQFIELLNAQKIKPPEKIRAFAIEGAKKQDALEQMCLSHAWDRKESRLIKIRKRQLQRLQQNYRQRKATLQEKLSFMRIHRLLEEEEKVLNQLYLEYPNDPEVIREKESFKERWAREIIARSRTAANAFHDLTEGTEVDLSGSEKNFVDQLFAAAQLKAKDNPSYAYNLALLFRFMGLFEFSLGLIKMAPESPSRDWLNLELLYESRRYIECLDTIQTVEMKYCNDPESTFGANYIRALCLWELNQPTAAIELMKSIINVRPNYRSARSFVSKWAGGSA